MIERTIRLSHYILSLKTLHSNLQVENKQLKQGNVV